MRPIGLAPPASTSARNARPCRRSRPRGSARAGGRRARRRRTCGRRKAPRPRRRTARCARTDAGKSLGTSAPQPREAELGAGGRSAGGLEVSRSSRVRRRRIGARSRERQVLAGARGRARRRAPGRPAPMPRLRPARPIERGLELGPLVLVQRLEPQRRHHRRPSTHWATPSERGDVTRAPVARGTDHRRGAARRARRARASVSGDARRRSATIAA